MAAWIPCFKIMYCILPGDNDDSDDDLLEVLNHYSLK